MYKFTIEYYYEKYHTGVLNPNKTRTGSVFAKNRSEAIAKLKLADNDYLGIEKVTFEETEDRSDT